jgi:hypothetical protein
MDGQPVQPVGKPLTPEQLDVLARVEALLAPLAGATSHRPGWHAELAQVRPLLSQVVRDHVSP